MVAVTLPNDIAVDLDGTLLRTDSLDEGLVKALFRVPMKAWKFPFLLMKGRAALKEKARPYSMEGVETMPVREDLIDWLKLQKQGGRKLHLVTAADREVADAAAARFGFFDSVIATENGHNLKGAKKKARLEGQFPEGFAYAGDSYADLAVFKAAGSIVLAGASSGVASAARKLGKPVEAEFSTAPGEQGPFALWRKALRLHQWSKNLILFIPLVLGHALTQPDAVTACLLGFVLMGLVASSTYIINDISDLTSDRQHETKKNRPFASGALSVRAGLAMAGVLMLAGFAGAVAVSPMFAGLLGIYTITTLSYSYKLKRVPMVDVTVLAFLYFMRLAVGAQLAGVPLSPWLSAFALFFFYSLSLAKRHTEIVKKAETMTGIIPGRGYHTRDTALTLPIGVAAVACSILIIVLFLVFEAFVTPDAYAHPEFLWPAPAIIALWVQRVWLLSARGELEDDPVSFAVKDKLSLALGALLLAFTMMAVFAPW
jgi:4-hydroxybenzoate polyprenyltransferase/phosphoserine phosphatase